MSLPIKITVLTIFPEMFPGPLGESVTGNALKEGLWEIEAVDIRDYAEDKHNSVDERPFGGGSGMVMRPDVLGKCIEDVLGRTKGAPRLVYLSPRGETFTQGKAKELSEEKNIILLCGRYEGVDQRIIEEYGFEEISVGDYVLSGGEIAAFSVIDACIRHISGVLGNAFALEEESFGVEDTGLLEYPHYTRPAEWKGKKVPEVLLSGHHEDIKRWRKDQAEAITRERRDDLWQQYKMADKAKKKNK